jgi:hypothetical protein
MNDFFFFFASLLPQVTIIELNASLGLNIRVHLGALISCAFCQNERLMSEFWFQLNISIIFKAL